jgi:hypothetical protein
MRSNSQGLALLNELGDKQNVECWGSQFDRNAGTSGFGIEIENILFGALDGIPNDLVVPTSSALFFGNSRPLLKCSHIQYFQDAAVQKFFDSLRPAGPLSTPAPTATSVVETQTDVKTSPLIKLKSKNDTTKGSAKTSVEKKKSP